MAIECDRALDTNGQEISIGMATSGANGYFCIGCGRDLVAHIGQVNQPHFKHHPKYSVQDNRCTYSSETHRHRIAKDVLQRLMRVKVPAVFQRAPAGWKRHQLQPTQFIEASEVLIERNIYENEDGHIRFGRSNGEPFDSHNGTRELLVRPDVMFLDKERRPILLIELCATHAVDEKKLVKLRRLGINTIEIYIPKTFTPEDVEGLFSSTSNTFWLYNREQFTTPIATTQPSVGTRGGLSIGDEGGISEQPESLKCRKLWIGAALRGIRKGLGSADYANTSAAYTELATRLKSELRERDGRADAAAAERMAEVKARHLLEEKELREAEGYLAEWIREKETQLTTVFDYLKKRVVRAKEEWRSDNQATEAELQAAEFRLSIERSNRESEYRRISGEADDLAREEEELRREETSFERQEESFTNQEREIQRGFSQVQIDSERVKEDFRNVAIRKDQLRQIKEKPHRCKPYNGE